MSKVFVTGLTIGSSIAYCSLTGGAGNNWQRRYKFDNTKTAIISGRSTHHATAQETGSQGLFGNIYG
jgi:hypothetical protein